MTDRELDAMIAEKVMGAVWQNITPKGRKKVLAFPKDRPMASTDGAEIIYYGMNGSNLPHYSTSIAAAWEVVEKMRALDFVVFEMSVDGTDDWHARFGKTWPPIEDEGFSKKPAEAICLAALAAKAPAEPKEGGKP